MDNDEEKNDIITLEFPKDTLDRISYIVFFPFHVILWMLPSYHKNPTMKKLVFSFILNLILLGVLLYFIETWTWEISKSFGIKIDIIGIILVSFGINFHYLIYNYRYSYKDTSRVEFF